MEEVVQYKFQPTPEQKPFFASTALEILFGGSKGPGKSCALVNYVFLYCMKYPGARCVLARRKLTMLMTSTWKTWEEWIPKRLYTFNNQSHIVKFLNGSEVIVTGLDSSEDIDRFNSMELSLVAIDEAQECLGEHYISLLTRLRQKLPNGTFPPYRMLCTANPAQCYLRNRFILAPIPGKREFIKALTKNNPHLSPTYLEDLKYAYKDNPSMYEMMVNGDWTISEGANSIFQYKRIEQCSNNILTLAFNNIAGVSCDIARFGDDLTVIYSWIGTRIVDTKISSHRETPQVAAECLAACMAINGTFIAIDETGGLGGPCLDFIKQIMNPGSKIKLIPFNSSSSPIDEKYLNKRAEATFEAAKLVNNGVVTLTKDPILHADLSALIFEYHLGKLKVVDKKKIKEDLGRSPDRGDAAIIGLYVMSKYALEVVRYEQAEYRHMAPETNTETVDQQMGNYEERYK